MHYVTYIAMQVEIRQKEPYQKKLAVSFYTSRKLFSMMDYNPLFDPELDRSSVEYRNTFRGFRRSYVCKPQSCSI